MRKEDLLADQDGTFAVPLQVEKIYNGKREVFADGWRNMLVFGDNLQFLKTIYKNEDPLIKDKGFIYVEADRDLTQLKLPSSWQQIKQTKAGTVRSGLFKKTTT